MKIDSSSKMQSAFFDVTLFNQLQERGRRWRVLAIPILRKNCNPIALFPIINTPPFKLSNVDCYICHLPLFITTRLPAHPQSITSSLGKVNSSILWCSYYIFSLIKHKSVFFEGSYGTSQTSKWEIFKNKVTTAFSRKQFLQKN